MNRNDILQAVQMLYDTCDGNILVQTGINVFDMPLVGIGSASDPLFAHFQKPEVIGPWFLPPTEWLPEAKTVISLFFPFTEEVKKSNRMEKEVPSAFWLYGRIEGQEYLSAFGSQWVEWFAKQGIAACVPVNDVRFQEISAGNGVSEYACASRETFGSNWSERHAGYVCGLGTFGVSKGLITEKGMAGRMLSIIISEEIQPDKRNYAEIYEYCTKCGACAERCPVHAISIKEGKDHTICSTWLKKTKELFAPRFGCGLCQTGVPCESRNPSKNRQ